LIKAPSDKTIMSGFLAIRKVGDIDLERRQL